MSRCVFCGSSENDQPLCTKKYSNGLSYSVCDNCANLLDDLENGGPFASIDANDELRTYLKQNESSVELESLLSGIQSGRIKGTSSPQVQNGIPHLAGQTFSKGNSFDSWEKDKEDQNVIKCPRCKSTRITTGARGWKWTTGFLGSGKTVNRCTNCGWTWKPSYWNRQY